MVVAGGVVPMTGLGVSLPTTKKVRAMMTWTTRHTDRRSRTVVGWVASTGGGHPRKRRAFSTQYLMASASEVMKSVVGITGAKNKPMKMVVTTSEYLSARSHSWSGNITQPGREGIHGSPYSKIQ